MKKFLSLWCLARLEMIGYATFRGSGEKMVTGTCFAPSWLKVLTIDGAKQVSVTTFPARIAAETFGMHSSPSNR